MTAFIVVVACAGLIACLVIYALPWITDYGKADEKITINIATPPDTDPGEVFKRMDLLTGFIMASHLKVDPKDDPTSGDLILIGRPRHVAEFRHLYEPLHLAGIL